MTQEKTIKKNYFVTGGGTGGHIYPALAVARALKADEETRKVFYVGCKHKPEFKLAYENEINFLGVSISSMPRKVSLKFPLWLLQLGLAVLQSMFYIAFYRPDAVFGTGGYVSAPMLMACAICGVPFVIHDGDAVPGLVSRKMAPFAKVVSCAFDDAKKFLKNKDIKVLGNPIRESFKTITRTRALNVLGLEDKFTLFVTGGSQGAKNLNRVIVELYKELVENFGIQIIHQTGEKNYDEVVAYLNYVYPAYKENSGIIIQPYFDDNAIPMKASNLAISRAGSLSISELHACGLPAILVPYPFAAANHQLKNALSAQEHQTAICIEENEFLKINLQKMLGHLISVPNSLDIMSNAAKNCAKFDSAKQIVACLKAVCDE